MTNVVFGYIYYFRPRAPYLIGPLGAGVYVTQVHTTYPQLRKAAYEKNSSGKRSIFPFVLSGSNSVSSQSRR
jgi:hypothetical protein